MTRPSRHTSGELWLSTTTTMSLTFILLTFRVHFDRSWRVVKYSIKDGPSRSERESTRIFAESVQQLNRDGNLLLFLRTGYRNDGYINLLQRTLRKLLVGSIIGKSVLYELCVAMDSTNYFKFLRVIMLLLSKNYSFLRDIVCPQAYYYELIWSPGISCTPSTSSSCGTLIREELLKNNTTIRIIKHINEQLKKYTVVHMNSPLNRHGTFIIYVLS
ncbi:Uncharacterized protein FWK35_00004441 [Aphis craccivora]|uniref:Uncharacterized protein n=1 Tax=Aphis craccivora TaxID=307492 RepID=A0A6G0YK85_APHCR|nr:Uncharacterized protein FWK35_00004441 [Aphis craccivora]